MDDEKTTAEPGDPKEADKEADAEGMDRRHFLNDSWKVLGVALVAEAAWTSYDLLKPGVAEGFGGVVDAGAVTDFVQDGSVKYLMELAPALGTDVGAAGVPAPFLPL